MEMHGCGHLVVETVMRTFMVVEVEVVGHPLSQVQSRGIVVQIHVLVLNRTLQALTKDIVQRSPPAIHTHPHSGGQQAAGERLGGGRWWNSRRTT